MSFAVDYLLTVVNSNSEGIIKYNFKLVLSLLMKYYSITPMNVFEYHQLLLRPKSCITEVGISIYVEIL
jgi:hypothetical protein